MASEKLQKITNTVFLSPKTIAKTWTIVRKKKPYTTITPKYAESESSPNPKGFPSYPQRASTMVINVITYKENNYYAK